jgi:hypothetical protein
MHTRIFILHLDGILIGLKSAAMTAPDTTGSAEKEKPPRLSL